MTSNPWADMVSLINGYQISQAISVVARLRVADHLKDGPRSADELASATESNPDGLYRVLRALASVGVFKEEDGKKFTLTPMGDCLRTDSPTPVSGWAMYSGSDYVWKTWGNLLHSARTGENAFQNLNGKSVWDYRLDHPEQAGIFNRAMTEMSRGGAEAIIEAYDFSPFQHVVDVGGGQGLMLAAILAAHSKMRGTLFDQPKVVAGAETVLQSFGVADRCDFIGGSFFESVPEGRDAYIMRAVIHDWEDAEAVAILKVCRRAMPDTAKLLLIEMLVGSPNAMPRAKFMDLTMLVLPGGRERTSDEYAALFEKSGFKLTRIVPAGRGAVIEAQPM
jgi:O-methyltransferase domain/Dimerisation domain